MSGDSSTAAEVLGIYQELSEQGKEKLENLIVTLFLSQGLETPEPPQEPVLGSIRTGRLESL